MAKYKILIIDDNTNDSDALKFILEDAGYSVDVANEPEVGIARARQFSGQYALAIIDFIMPGLNGAETAKRISEYAPELNIITHSGDKSVLALASVLQSGSRYFIQKGEDTEKLLAVVKSFCSKFEEVSQTVQISLDEGELAKAISSIGLIGRSTHLKQVADLVHIYARSRDTVLIQGENGTGKEKVAHAIHVHSNVSKGPFVVVNCGAIPEGLFESEFFGHKKGSFTGALSDKAGLLVTANNGTVFLDEIGDMKLDLQVKILRFLQQSEVKPVGSDKITKVNVRVVAATNKNLFEAVRAGTFREDLYYRLNVLNIDLLPLRERAEDIEPLVAHFQERFKAETGQAKEFLKSTVQKMSSYAWPGNVRELENRVKRLLYSVPRSQIRVEDLDPFFFERSPEISLWDCDYQEFRRNLDNQEREYLIRKLQPAKSIREAAKEHFKITHTTLLGRMKALGIKIKKTKIQRDEVDDAKA